MTDQQDKPFNAQQFEANVNEALNSDCLHCRLTGMAWAFADFKKRTAGKEGAPDLDVEETVLAAAKMAGEFIAQVAVSNRSGLIQSVMATVLAFAVLDGKVPTVALLTPGDLPPTGSPPGRTH